MELPQRVTALNERGCEIRVVSKTESLEASLTSPKIDKADPIRTADLIDMEDPRERKSTVLILEPNEQKLRTEKDDPMCT
jgi:hypothetical protein